MMTRFQCYFKLVSTILVLFQKQTLGSLLAKLSGSAYATKESKIVSEYDQETPQSQTADNSMAPQGRATQPSRDTRKTN